jgi:hypothetical protein
MTEKDNSNLVTSFYATETVDCGDCGEIFLERQEKDYPNMYTEERSKELVKLSKNFDKKNKMNYTYKIYRLVEVKP